MAPASAPLRAGVLALLLGAAPAAAQLPTPGQPPQEQSRQCELVENRYVLLRVLGENNTNSYVSGPLEVQCEGGVRIQADSAVVYQASSYTQFFGNVLFEDPERRLTADRANYFNRDRRLVALGRGRIIDKVRSSVITGDTVVYARANAFRPQDILNVHGGSPHALIHPPPPEPEEEEPDAESRAGEGGEAGDAPPADTVGAGPGTPEPAIDAAAAAAAPAALGRGTPEASPDTAAAAADPPVADPAATRGAAAAEPDTAGAAPPEGGVAPARPAPRPLRPARQRPYEVDAVRFSLVGDGLFRALGDVVIRRDGLEAFGDTLELQQDQGDVKLTGNARIEEEAFDLKGRSIFLGESADGAQEVRAVDDALLVSEQVDLTAPEIRIYLLDGGIDRLVAVREVGPDTPAEDAGVGQGGGRTRALPTAGQAPAPAGPPAEPAGDEEADDEPPQPRAITEQFVLTGDSIEVVAPAEVLETVTAVGRARGESQARDSLNAESTPDVARTDWLEGNRIVARFVAVPPTPGEADDADASPSFRIDQIVAQGSARSLYRMPPSDSAGVPEPGRLAVHYVTGNEITLILRDGELEDMEIHGQARGFHLEPQPAGLPPDTVPSDTTAVADTAVGGVPVDTAAPVVDTAGAAVRPDTVGAGGAAAAVRRSLSAPAAGGPDGPPQPRSTSSRAWARPETR